MKIDGMNLTLPRRRAWLATIMELSASGAFEGSAVFAGYSIAYAGKKYDSYAGFAEGDVIIKWDGKDVKDLSSLLGHLAKPSRASP